MSSPIRTRFAPSPTGFLHLGGARTALFSWAYARHHGGSFVLRIEDTDIARSTPEATQAILDAMDWLGLQPDEGPFYQTQRFDRYRAVIADMLAQGSAYYCYSSHEEVEAMREAARAVGRKPRYDGTWRPESGKTLPSIPANRPPVVRFKNPIDGVTAWDDLVKGPISIANSELDDLVIARADGTPTYNFCVVVDDWDMQITHVLRGDDHVNNTPRQINILRALGAEVPKYGHVPMILGPDGQKLSKRHGAVNVMEYQRAGYLPEAMVNYLARLGWSHGDDEIFSRAQLIDWFDADHLSKSASQWDPKKLDWVNAHYLKQSDDVGLASQVAPRIVARGGDAQACDLTAVVALVKDRASTLEQLADAAMLFCASLPQAPDELVAQHLDEAACVVLRDFAARASAIDSQDWNRDTLATLIKEVLSAHSIKMPKLGVPLRVAVTGQTQTPAVDAVLAILGKDVVLGRLQKL